MARPYTNNIADVTAGFPTNVYTPVNFRNEDLNGYDVINETFTVPAAPDGDGKYRMELDFIPLEQSTFEMTADGDPLTPIPWGEAPAADNVALSLETAGIEFHASRAGAEILTSYRARGSDLTSQIFNRLQKELAAAQSEIKTGARFLHAFFFGVASAMTAANQEVRFAIPAGLKCVGVQVVWADASVPAVGTTTIRASNAVVGTAIADPVTKIDATVGAAAYSGSETTGTISFASAGTLYVFVQSGGSHQNIQVSLRLERI